MKIIEATDAIEIKQCRMLLYGQPGIGKSSLGYACDDPLNLDFDEGAHRAQNRKRTVQIESWPDVEELLGMRDFLVKHNPIVLDTVGRCLDMMTVSIIKENGKLGFNGNLSPQGWGVLKGRFRTFMAQLEDLGRDVVMIAHDKEERSGDIKTMRPDIQGGSYGEVLKVADFVGYYYIQGKDRVLDFSPTDQWIGKNPPNWKPFKVPALAKSPRFLSELLLEGRNALGKLSEDSAVMAKEISDWAAKMDEFTTLEDINGAIPSVTAITPVILLEQVKRALGRRARNLGFSADKASGKFVAAEKTA